MASVFRRKNRAGKLIPNWSYAYLDADGKRRTGTGSTDKTATLRIAQRLESDAKLISAGLIDRQDQVATEAARLPIATHVADYRAYLVDKGDTERHARHTAGAITRLLEDARVTRLAELAPEGLQAAHRRLRESRSTRTANFALGAVKAFVRWCAEVGRLAAVPRWLTGLKPANARIGIKRVRRALTAEELARLLERTEKAPPIRLGGKRGMPRYEITGPERAALYRLAACTGLRANEIRTLDATAFHLAGDDPHVVVKAAYSKHRREDRQPLRRADASWLAEWLAGREGKPVVVVPERTAKWLARDLEAAGIAVVTQAGVVDFHALRATYITLLLDGGASPKQTQVLARHSTITLTLDRYAKVTEENVRKALEGEDPAK